MNQNWRIANKALGVIEILIGLTVMILSIYSWRLILTILEDQGLTWERISFIKLIKRAHFVFLLGLLGFVSGVLLLKGKRWGWITSMASLVLYPIAMILILMDRNKEGLEPLEDRGDFFLTGIVLIAFLALIFLLALKPIKVFYSIKIRDWVIAGVIVLLFTIDKLIIN
ncbi:MULTISPECIES: hypothetical protein [Flavobacteriaceae]|uniref:hypothetical protein n=1 Tax=Flavobacteriaceae TaxID=49546 RepID=UPI00234923D7|nr:hypothetical protein [Muricauda sp. SP22]MDC6362391.1 hypothetical protein [Muricauda sp. SP22]